MKMTSQLTRFIFDNREVRGAWVRVDDVLAEMFAKHDYNAYEQTLLGELVCSAVLLSALLKITGKFTLQIQSQGTLKLAVVQINNNTDIRAMLSTQVPLDSTDLKSIARDGHFLVSIYQPDMSKPYQSYVPISDGRLSQTLMDYFQQSEQLKTAIQFAGSETGMTGVLFQVLPNATQEDWDYLEALTSTLTSTELASLPCGEILHRLFHEDEVRLFEPASLNYKCTCSEEKMLDTLATLGQDSINELADADDKIAMQCDFCKTSYVLSAKALRQKYH